MNRKELRIALIKEGKRLIDLHRLTGISYNRLVRLANGYSEPRAGELASISSALRLPVTALGRVEE